MRVSIKIQNLVAKEYCFVPVHIVHVLYACTGIIYALLSMVATLCLLYKLCAYVCVRLPICYKGRVPIAVTWTVWGSLYLLC